MPTIIKNGSRVEIKGFQDLKKMPLIIENEIKRQQKTKVKPEVRKSNIDGSSTFLRPIPGSARMYPETDIKPIPITKKLLNSIKKPELISEIYLQAWKNKLKGVTIYRDGSRYPILSTEGELSDFQRNKEKEYSTTNEEGEKITVKGDDIIKLPDGTLITMYHYLKNSNNEIEEVLSATQFEDATT